MSKGKNQKQIEALEGYFASQGAPTPKRSDNDADINFVIQTLNSLPSLRRYGKDEEAIEEAKAAMLRIKGRV